MIDPIDTAPLERAAATARQIADGEPPAVQCSLCREWVHDLAIDQKHCDPCWRDLYADEAEGFYADDEEDCDDDE